MYSHFQLLQKYIHYYVTAGNGRGHGMHSPFIFRFILHVLNNKSGFQAPPAIETLRKGLQRDKRMLDIKDLGAGSRLGSLKQRTVQQLARTAVKPKKYGQLFYRLVNYYRPSTVVELGTSLGITTAYIAAANPEGQVITIEGSEAIFGVATDNFRQLKLSNIRPINENFDVALPAVLKDLDRIDLAYIDGNHRYGPTLSYFLQILTKADQETILVFDDIHWSAEMEKAWEEIRLHPLVRSTVDLFFLGIVFLREDFKEKQHFTIRF